MTSWVPAVTGHPLEKGWGLVLAWAGLRGAVSLATVLSLPGNLPDRDLLVQGLTIQPLVLCQQALFTRGRLIPRLRSGGSARRLRSGSGNNDR